MSRAQQVIDQLDLTHHPEGGHFREMYRSPATVNPSDDRGHRSAVTSIYFLLAAGEHSKWHLVESDEVWHYYEGDPLEILTLDPATFMPQRRLLGPLAEGHQPLQIVPAGQWQAARPLGAYTLVGCSVAPGFEFADFTLMRDDRDAERRLLECAPEVVTLL